MALKALKIVEEELANYDAQTRGQYQGVIAHLKQRITNRIEQECIELPEEFCSFCGETESDCVGGGFDSDTPAHDFAKGGISKLEIPDCDGCHEPHRADGIFWRQDAHCDPPRKVNLCGDCVRALKEDGVSIEHYREQPTLPPITEPEEDIPF